MLLIREVTCILLTAIARTPGEGGGGQINKAYRDIPLIGVMFFDLRLQFRADILGFTLFKFQDRMNFQQNFQKKTTTNNSIKRSKTRVSKSKFYTNFTPNRVRTFRCRHKDMSPPPPPTVEHLQHEKQLEAVLHNSVCCFKMMNWDPLCCTELF